MQGNTISWIVIGAGAIVALIGWYVSGIWGAGILGYGLAHIVLGVLDMYRTTTIETQP